jgi:hypothetical protein
MKDGRWVAWRGSGEKKGRTLRELRENVDPKERGQGSLAVDNLPSSAPT